MIAIVIEGNIVMNNISDVPQAFCLLFALTYALHLDYPRSMLNTFSDNFGHVMRLLRVGAGNAPYHSEKAQTSAVLCSGGCALLAVSSLLAIITIFLPSGGCERRACSLAGYMQMAAGRLLSL
uniref:Uncharacterized protein n=1 Tax=Knipowitschia caucasica TaxID=637954 RepID=A0AAV2JAH6_KNICA